MKLHALEEEVILLRAAYELIDSMVNFEVLRLGGSDLQSEVQFNSATHQKYFNILLVDFLSRTDKNSPVEQASFLGAVRSICQNPNFNADDSISALRSESNNFRTWLNQEIEIETWLPSISKKTNLNITRISLIKIGGNISKHNFLRLSGLSKEIGDLLSKSGVTTNEYDFFLVISDLYERFHTDIFNYHGSTISEFLNNIRWGIYEYLQPEFKRSIVWESHSPPKYHYIIPSEINTEFGKECYRGLMNEVRCPPYMRKFEVTKFLKLRY
jgi:hypothetical protein